MTGDSQLADVYLPDISLLWKVAAFSGPHCCFLDSQIARKRINDIYSLFPDPLKIYTDDIWQRAELAAWATADRSSLLDVQSEYESVARTTLFAAQLVECVEKQVPAAFATCEFTPWPAGDAPFDLTASQVMRHVVVQALSNIVRSVSLLFLAEMVLDFTRAEDLNEWADLLERILLHVPKLYIIIHLGRYGGDQEYQAWTRICESLISKARLSTSPRVIKVALIRLTIVPNKMESSTHVMSVRQKDINRGLLRIPIPTSSSISKRSIRVFSVEDMNNMGYAAPLHNSAIQTVSTPTSKVRHNSSQLQHVVEPTCLIEQNYEPKPRGREDFEVAIFCALPQEADAVIALFDQHWNRKEYEKVCGDPNSYTLGAIGNYNVVLVHMPGMGKNIAASVASSCRASFSGIRLALVVGICGGVPLGVNSKLSVTTERILGDVIISDGLVQYDFGRQYTDEFIRKNTYQDVHSRPGQEIRGFLAMLAGQRSQKFLYDSMQRYVATLRKSTEFTTKGLYEYPGTTTDVLYNSAYIHRHRDAKECPSWAEICGTTTISCEMAKQSDCEALKCDASQQVERPRLTSTTNQLQNDGPKLVLHIGRVASADKVMKSGTMRDQVARDENIVAFEMEGNGIWEQFPCLIIKGISDYADCHKNKKWQNFAAGMAAACMKAVLEQWG